MGISQTERAHRTWPILVKRAGEYRTITYGELASGLGIHHRAVKFVLSLIQDHCLKEKLPPLTILVVNQSGRPGEGFVAYDANRNGAQGQVSHSNIGDLLECET